MTSQKQVFMLQALDNPMTHTAVTDNINLAYLFFSSLQIMAVL